MEEERSTDIDLGLGDLVGILRQCWILMLVAAMVVGVGLYAFLNATHVDEYTATATIHVGNASNSSTSQVTSGDMSLANTLVKDCLVVVQDKKTLKEVIANENLIIDDFNSFSSNVSVTNKTDTRFVYVSVTAADPEAAAEIATAVAEVSCKTLNDLYGNGKTDEKENIFKVYSEGEAPEGISNPVSKLTVLLVAFAAAAVIYVIYLIMFLMDDKINDPEDVEKYLKLSILGQIPNKQDAGRRKKYYAYDASTK